MKTVEARVKLKRQIVGVVAQVTMPCGCNAIVAKGKAFISIRADGGDGEFFTKHFVQHVCPEWKRHKYKLADAERDLAKRIRKYRLSRPELSKVAKKGLVVQ